MQTPDSQPQPEAQATPLAKDELRSMLGYSRVATVVGKGRGLTGFLRWQQLWLLMAWLLPVGGTGALVLWYIDNQQRQDTPQVQQALSDLQDLTLVMVRMHSLAAATDADTDELQTQLLGYWQELDLRAAQVNQKLQAAGQARLGSSLSVRVRLYKTEMANWQQALRQQAPEEAGKSAALARRQWNRMVVPQAEKVLEQIALARTALVGEMNAQSSGSSPLAGLPVLWLAVGAGLVLLSALLMVVAASRIRARWRQQLKSLVRLSQSTAESVQWQDGQVLQVPKDVAAVAESLVQLQGQRMLINEYARRYMAHLAQGGAEPQLPPGLATWPAARALAEAGRVQRNLPSTTGATAYNFWVEAAAVGTLPPPDSFQQWLAFVVQGLRAQYGLMFLCSATQPEGPLTLALEHLGPAQVVARRLYAWGEGPVGRCAARRLPMQLDDLMDEPLSVRSQEPGGEAQALLLLPLVAGQRLLGVLELGLDHPPDAMSLPKAAAAALMWAPSLLAPALTEPTNAETSAPGGATALADPENQTLWPQLADRGLRWLVVNARDELVHASTAWAQSLGLLAGTFQGTELATWLASQNQAPLLAERHTRLADGKRWEGMYCYRPQKGLDLWMRALWVPVRWQGEPHYLGIEMDITEVMNREKTLVDHLKTTMSKNEDMRRELGMARAEREEWQRTHENTQWLVQALNHAAWLWHTDVEGRLVEFSESLVQTLGRDLTPMLSKPWWEVLQPPGTGRAPAEWLAFSGPMQLAGAQGAIQCQVACHAVNSGGGQVIRRIFMAFPVAAI